MSRFLAKHTDVFVNTWITIGILTVLAGLILNDTIFYAMTIVSLVSMVVAFIAMNAEINTRSITR